jgi:serine/threonine protein kinase
MVRAHNCDIVHGRLSPECVLLDDQNRPKLTGFSAMATLQPARYSAPEHAETKEADAFALGLILYEVLIHSAEESPENARLRLAGGPIPGVPNGVSRAIAGSLAENPGQRPSIEDMLDEIEMSRFALGAGVDTDAVRAFAEWIEDPLNE